MSLNDVMVSSVSNHWCSPPEILGPAREVKGGRIDFDPASNPMSIVDAEVECMLERGDDGLSTPWAPRGFFWLNSPFGRALGLWTSRVVAEGDAGAEGICLTPSRTGSGWCQNLLRRSDAHCFLKGRLKFIGAKRVDMARVVTQAQLEALARAELVKLEPAPFDCLVSYVGPRALAFRRVFASLGIVEIHPRRRRGAWRCEVLLQLADDRLRWTPSEWVSYSKARDEADAWTARGFQARLREEKAQRAREDVEVVTRSARVVDDRQLRLA